MKIRDIFLFLKILGNTLCNPLFIKEKKMSRSSNGYPGSKGIETPSFTDFCDFSKFEWLPWF